MADRSELPDVHEGERPSAGWHNTAAELLRREQTGPQMMVDSTGIHQAPEMPRERIIWIKNASGSALGLYEVLGLDDMVTPYNPQTNLDRFKETIVFEGKTPTTESHLGKFGIVQEPIADEGIGRVMVSGESQVVVKMLMPDDTSADVADGYVEYLESGGSGSAQILWVDDTEIVEGTGLYWAVVRFGGGGSGAWTLFELSEDWVPPISPYEDYYQIKAVRYGPEEGEEETICFLPPDFFGVGRHGRGGIQGTRVFCRRQNWYISVTGLEAPIGETIYWDEAHWVVTGGSFARVLPAKAKSDLFKPTMVGGDPEHYTCDPIRKVKLFVKRYDDILDALPSHDVVAGDHAKAEPDPAAGPRGLGSWEVEACVWGGYDIAIHSLCMAFYSPQENRWYVLSSPQL